MKMCTTIIVTPGATTDGSMYVTHSDDNELSDERLVYVPAANHPAKSKRPVYPHLVGYPRFVGKGVAPAYDLSDFKKTVPLGNIPQVPHTFAYYDGCYGIMNEHQLCFGECTDAAQKYERKHGDAEHLFYSAELARVALERCKTAREAIDLMGNLIDTYGFYGTGETLPVGDTKEGWVLEMCAVPNGKGLWVAQKVHDGEIWVGANTFTIREIDKDNPDILYSPNLFAEAERLGWWNPNEGPLDWLKTASWGEYSHPYYSLRRVWSVLGRANPTLDLPPYVEDGFTREYPFSVKPEKPMCLEAVMGLHRSHYESTEFDMAKKPGAGPFGNPNRYYDYKDYDNSSSNLTVPNPGLWGAFERPVSVYYTGYVYVCQARSFLPDEVGGVLWFGYDQPSTTCFVPFYAGATGLPKAYEYGSMNFFDRSFAFWAFNCVSNLACLKYSYMIKDIVAKQQELEGNAIDSRTKIEDSALKLLKKDPKKARQYLTEQANTYAEDAISQWWNLSDFLMFRYSDGYDNAHTKLREDGNVVKDSQELPYPLKWRKEVGYAQGPTTYYRHK
jgi:dipeptidase